MKTLYDIQVRKLVGLMWVKSLWTRYLQWQIFWIMLYFLLQVSAQYKCILWSCFVKGRTTALNCALQLSMKVPLFFRGRTITLMCALISHTLCIAHLCISYFRSWLNWCLICVRYQDQFESCPS